MTEKQTDITVREEEREPLRMDETALENVKHNVTMMQRAMEEVLEDGVDYGTVPGVKDPFLFDPGASKVRDFYDTYPEHTVLARAEEDGLLTIMMEAKLVYRRTGQVVACGVGAASMKESRYRYRWVDNPEEYGYNRAECRKKKDRYRILNPEVDELVNTIMKIAAKRAEVDASQNLPGVAAAIAKLRKGDTQGNGRWTRFWGEVNRMGLSEEDAKMICRVGSMKEWLAQGKSLDQAIDLIRTWVVKRNGEKAQADIFPPEGNTEDAPRSTLGTTGDAKPLEYDLPLIKGPSEFYQACWECFQLQPPEALAKTGFSRQQDVSSWADAFSQVAGTLGITIVEPKGG